MKTRIKTQEETMAEVDALIARHEGQDSLVPGTPHRTPLDHWIGYPRNPRIPDPSRMRDAPRQAALGWHTDSHERADVSRTRFVLSRFELSGKDSRWSLTSLLDRFPVPMTIRV